MAGNSNAPGARRRPGSKKGATKGTGGKNRRSLEGRGPTPKAEERTYHAAAKRKASEERRAAHTASAQARAGARRDTTGAAGVNVSANCEVIAGRNPVLEALRAAVVAKRIFMLASVVGDARLMEVVQLAAESGAPVVEVTRAELDRLTDGAVHQGVAIEVPEYKYASVDELLGRAGTEKPLLVALDGVTDPQNLGAVIRSGAAFGAHGVILPARRSAGVNVTVWKVSAGAAARMGVAQVSNLVNTLKELQRAGCFVLGLDGDGDTSIANIPVATEGVVLVTGAEGKGLSHLVRRTCDLVVSIPISADMESLNAAVATGIALYQISQTRAGNPA